MISLPDNAESIEHYLNSSNTIETKKMRKTSLNYFFGKSYFNYQKSVFDVKTSDLIDYFNYLKKQDLTLTTKENKWHIITSFLNFLMEYYNQFNFVIGIPSKTIKWGENHKKSESNKNITATKEEIKQILECFKGYNYKYYLMFRILAESGMRKGELIYIKYTDIDTKKRIIETFGKTGLKAYYISKNLAIHLEMYIEQLKKLDAKISNLFVVKYKGKYKQYSSRALDIIIKNCKEQVNINKQITCHTFRRTINTLRKNMGCSNEDRKILLNHKTTSDVNLNSYVVLEYDNYIKMYDQWNPYQDLKL